MSNYQPLNRELHAKLRLKPQGGYSFASKQHLVSVVLHEFSNVALSYPIVFVKSVDQVEFHPMALLGLELSKNLFVDTQGQWSPGAYVPAAFRRYPFALTDTGAGSMAICVDTESPYLNAEEGESLFDDAGAVTPTMEKISSFLQELLSSEVMATSFCTSLASLDLLAPCEFKVQGPEGVKVYGGSFMVDEQKLSALSTEAFLSLRDKGYLGAIYAHLISHMQVQKFAALQSNVP